MWGIVCSVFTKVSVVSVRSELTISNKPNCLPALHGRTCVPRPLT